MWVGNLGEDKRSWVLDDPKNMASCVARRTSAVGLPKLVEALPPMPETGEVCSLCKGAREMHEEILPRAEDGFRGFCRRCAGWGGQATPNQTLRQTATLSLFSRAWAFGTRNGGN